MNARPLELIFKNLIFKNKGSGREMLALLKQAKLIGRSQISLPLLGLGGGIFTWQLIRFRRVPRFMAVEHIACGRVAAGESKIWVVELNAHGQHPRDRGLTIPVPAG